MHLLIIGANSDIAFAIAKMFVLNDKATLCLASRDMEMLKKKATDLQIRYQVEAQAIFFDAVDFNSHKDFYNLLEPKPDGVVISFGYLGNQKRAENDFGEAKDIIEINFLAAVSILELIVADFEKRSSGFIIGISSVAGERGRQSNYIYGAAKSAFSTYLSGLRNRLTPKGINVMTILPGFARTKMTEELILPEKFTTLPEDVAKDVYNAFKESRDIVYTPWYWKWIMACIKMIPERIFKHMKL